MAIIRASIMLEAGGVPVVEETTKIGSKGKPSSCNYYGIGGHWTKECHNKQNDIRTGKLPQNNYASADHEDSSKNDQLLAMTHVMA